MVGGDLRRDVIPMLRIGGIVIIHETGEGKCSVRFLAHVGLFHYAIMELAAVDGEGEFLAVVCEAHVILTAHILLAVLFDGAEQLGGLLPFLVFLAGEFYSLL